MCCGGDDEAKKGGSELFVDNKDRSCTNCLCLIIFGVFWIAFIAVLAFALYAGDSNAVFYGTDYTGHPCNETQGIYIYYPQLSDDVRFAIHKLGQEAFGDVSFSSFTNLEINLYGVCVDECPGLGDVVCNYDGNKDRCGGCLKEDKEDSEVCKDDCKECWIVPLRTKSYFYRCLFELTESTAGSELCSNPRMLPLLSNGSTPTENYIYANDSRCLSKEVTTVNKKLELTFDDPVSDSLMTYTALMNSWISDICSAWVVILLCGVVIPIAAGFLFVLLIKYIISCFIYMVYILLVLLSIFVCVFCFMKAGYFTVDDINSISQRGYDAATGFANNYLDFNVTNDNVNNITLPHIFAYDERYATYWKVGAWVSLAFIILVVLFIFFTWRAIKVVVGVIKEASNALYKMPMLIFLPIIFIIQIGLIMAFFVASSAFLTSINDIDTVATDALNSKLKDYNETCSQITNIGINCNITVPTITTNDAGFYLIWFNLFGFLWTNEFIHGIFLMVVAGSVARWYFTKLNDKGDKEVSSPICSSLYMVYRYHLGSIAFASLIVGIIKFIRYVLMYIQKSTSGTQSRILRCILCCLQCCFWCLEKCMQFISRNSYIYIAIKGVGFCSAARSVFGLIASNMARFSLLNTTTYVIIFIGKLAIALLGGVLSYLVLSGYQLSEYFSGLFNLDFGNVFIPTAVTLILAFYVAIQFLGVYSMVIDTVLICFLLDEAAVTNGTSDCMPKALRDAIGLAEHKESSATSNKPVSVDDVQVISENQ